jgi:hypothetical protein
MRSTKSLDTDSITTRSLVIKSLRSEVYPKGTIAYSDGTGFLRFSTLAGISPSYIAGSGTLNGADLTLTQNGLSTLSTGIGSSYSTLLNMVSSVSGTIPVGVRYSIGNM